MRRINLFIAAMCCLVLSQPLMAKDLFMFCGKMITSDNYKDINNYKPDIATGYISVDLTNGLVIKLEDFKCQSSNPVFKFNEVDVTLRLNGSNSVSTSDSVPFITSVDSKITITGSKSDTLKIYNGNIDILLDKSTEYHTFASKLSIIGGCNISLNFSEVQFVHFMRRRATIMGNGSELEIADGSTVIVEGDGKNGTISGFKKVKLDGCEVYSPASASYDDFNYLYNLYGETITSRMIIGPESKDTYFEFCDIRVNDVNYAKVTEYASRYITEGTVSITVDGDSISCDLTDAKIDCSNAAEPVVFKMMYNYGVNINLHGYNSIKAGSSSLGTNWAIYNAFGNNSVLNGDVYNFGYGQLTIEYGYIYINSAPFTIKNCDLTVAGDGDYTIVGSKNPSDILHISGGKVTLKGATSGTIRNIASLDTQNGFFATPEDATYDTEKMQLVSQGAIVKSDVVFMGYRNTAVEQISKDENNLKKVMIDGQVYIIRDNNAYNVLGQQVNY